MCACSHDRWADSGCDLLTFCVYTLHSNLPTHVNTKPFNQQGLICVLFFPGVDSISSGGWGLGSEVTAGHRGWDVWHRDWRKPRLFPWCGPSSWQLKMIVWFHHVHLRRTLFTVPTMWLQRLILLDVVYCCYLACVGTAATEGSWENERLHQPDPSGSHGQTQRVPGEDWVSAQKLSESNVVSDRLASFPGCVEERNPEWG